MSGRTSMSTSIVWTRVPAKMLFTRMQRPPRVEDGVVTAFRDGQVTLRSNRREEGFTNAVEEIGYQGVRSGDLVIHSMDAFAGALGVSESDGKMSPVVHCYQPVVGVDARFYAYLLRDMARHGFIASLAKGIRERSTSFDVETFRSLRLPVPPLDAQVAIADYLDFETARIDALMAKKKQQIEACVSRTESLIADRLDGAIRIHGEIPLKFVARIDVSNIDKKSYEGQQSVLLCNYTDVYYNRKIALGIDFMEATAEPHQVRRLGLRAGDVLITKDSETADDIAVPAYVVEDLPEVVLGYHLALLRATKVRGDFLYWALRSRRCRDSFSLAASGVTRVGLRQDAMGRVPIPNIPIQQQEVLVADLEKYATGLDGLEASIKRQIELLRERRQALITAAVTGELDIPGVVA